MRRLARTYVRVDARTHARIHGRTCTGCPGRKRARPRVGVTLFSNFPFMGYRLVSICRFVTMPGDLHGQIGLLHAAIYPAPLLHHFVPLLVTAFYITIFRHRARDLLPLDSSRDNLFFLPFSPCFFPFFPPLFLPLRSLSLRLSLFVRRSFLEDNARPRTLHFKCERAGDRSRIASVPS